MVGALYAVREGKEALSVRRVSRGPFGSEVGSGYVYCMLVYSVQVARRWVVSVECGVQ